MLIQYDCRHFLGYKPCVFRCACAGCSHYAPIGHRILIIKLAAPGDVLRTTPLLRGLRRAHPDAHITWLTDPEVVPLLDGIPEIDRLLTFSFETVLPLYQEAFDQLFCFDKEPRAIALATAITAGERAGFGMATNGVPVPLNANSEYMFELGINDDLKFRRNHKTYPELLFECAGLPYPEPQEYILPDLGSELAWGRELFHSSGVAPGRPKVGLNTGASNAFATKKWTEAGYAELSDLLAQNLQATVFLLGGPSETERNARIADMAQRRPLNSGTNHSLRRFAGIIGNLDLLVTGDTLAMHIAIGLRVPVIALFGATCPQEIELYQRGAKIVSDFDCSPCYSSVCLKDPTCMQAIPTQTVFQAATRLLASGNMGEKIPITAGPGIFPGMSLPGEE